MSDRDVKALVSALKEAGLEDDIDLFKRDDLVSKWLKSETERMELPDQGRAFGMGGSSALLMHIVPVRDAAGVSVGAHVVLFDGSRMSRFDPSIGLDVLSAELADKLGDSRYVKVLLASSFEQIQWVRTQLKVNVVGCICLDLAPALGLHASNAELLDGAIASYAASLSEDDADLIMSVGSQVLGELCNVYKSGKHWKVLVYESCMLAGAAYWMLDGVEVRASMATIRTLAKQFAMKNKEIENVPSWFIESLNGPLVAEERLASTYPQLAFRLHERLPNDFHMILSAVIDSLLKPLLPSPADIAVKDNIIRLVVDILDHAVMMATGNANQESCSLFLFGSCANGFGHRTSDLDMLFLPPPGVNLSLKKASQSIRSSHQFSDILLITRSVVPVLTFKRDTRAGLGVIDCDLSTGPLFAVHNSKMLLLYSKLDIRVVPLVLMLKQWSKSRKINGAGNSQLSSYAWSVLAISVLQHMGILPNLQDPDPAWSPPPATVHVSDGPDTWNVGFVGDEYTPLPPWSCEASPLAKASVSHLFLALLHTIAFEIDFAKVVVSIRRRAPMSVAEKKAECPDFQIEKPFKIEDPFILSRNVGRHPLPNHFETVMEEARRTYTTLCTSPPNDARAELVRERIHIKKPRPDAANGGPDAGRPHGRQPRYARQPRPPRTVTQSTPQNE